MVDESLIRGRKHLVHARELTVVVEPPFWFMGRVRVNNPVRLGAFTYLKRTELFGCSSIGRYCSLADGVRIGEPEHPTDWLSTSPFAYNRARFNWNEEADDYEAQSHRRELFQRGSASIGNDVWIAANVMILRGVRIGDGAIVAAGAVVTKDVEPYTIVGGLPAKPLRKRFDDETIAELLELRWWRFTPNQLSGVPFHDIDAAIAEVRTRIDAGMEPYEPEKIELTAPPKKPKASKQLTERPRIKPRAPRRLWARLRRSLRR